MSRSAQFILLFVCFSSFSAAYAAETNVPADFQLWLTPTASFKINKHWGLEAYEQLRLDGHFDHYKAAISGVEVSYKKKWFEAAAGYNYFAEIGDFRHRFLIYGQASWEKKKWTISDRLRCDENLYRFNEPATVLRDMVSVSYDFHKKWTASVSSELFYEYSYNYANFNRLRSAIGISYELTKKDDMKLKQYFQQDFNVVAPHPTWITALSWVHGFDLHKKKQKTTKN